MNSLMSEPGTDSKTNRSNVRRWYSFSFDRDSFNGRYPSRDEALRGAHETLLERSEMPEAIYVARRVPIDLHERGHAQTVIQAIRDDARGHGDDASYVKNLAKDDLDDLDAALARCVREWAKRCDLTPDVEHFEAVSEHAVPLISHVDQPETDEIGPLGPDRP